MTMAIVDILNTAQNGKYFANAGQAAGLSESDARTAVAALAPAIAERLKDKAAADPDAFDQLLDLLEEGGDSSDLDDADAMTGAEAQKDGGAILDDLYGSRSEAMTALGKLAPHAKGKALESISAISATSVLASLAATNANTLAADQGAGSGAGSAGGGIISVIIAALMKGLMQGVARQVAPRRRRRRTYGYYYGRRPARRRRTRRPGLDDIFKSVLTGRR
jgi:hypothetical protein